MPFYKTANTMLAMPRAIKRAVVLCVDAGLCALTVWLAFYLRLEEWVAFAGDSRWNPGLAALGSMVLALPIFFISGLYREIFRYAGWQALVTIARAIAIYALLFTAVFTVIGVDGVPRAIGLVQPILLLLAVGTSRALAGYWLGGLYRHILKRTNLPKALIYGAGSAGMQLTAALANSHELQVVGYLDDDARLRGHVLNGLPVHAPHELPGLVEAQGICDVLLAIPSVSRQRRNEILKQMLEAHVFVRTLPSLADLTPGRITTADLRELDIEDLLGRVPVSPNHILLGKNVRDKVVLVTGAGGSIGSELCRQIAKLEPTALLLVEQSEFALYALHQELSQVLGGEGRLVPLLASVRDAERLREIMAAWRPQTVYHAAAYKHVPLVEHNPAEGLRNNVFGTLTAARVALEQGVADFVLISTDKAVRPTNIMGASKRLAEMVLQALAAQASTTRFTMVRFGNVLDSSGSVVPKFRQQIRDGGPITLTHPEVTRFFMTIPEAAQLVIQAGAMASNQGGGEVFVLDMGEPVKIADLARRMVELSGLTVRDDDHPEGDIEIQVVGLRPGEKLYEELLIGNNPQPTSHSRIMKASEDFLSWLLLEEKLGVLLAAIDGNDVPAIRRLLEDLVSGYRPEGDIVDWVHLAHEAKAA